MHPPIVLVLAAALLFSLPSGPAESNDPRSLGEPHPASLFLDPTSINTFEQDRWIDGVWIASRAGLLLYEPGAPGAAHLGIRDGLPSLMLYDLEATPAHLWIATASGPVVLDKSTGAIVPVRDGLGDEIANSTRTLLAENMTIWIGTDDAGLWKIDRESHEATPIDNPLTREPFHGPILGLASVDETLFVSVAGYGLVAWDRASEKATLHDKHLLVDEPAYGRVIANGTEAWVATSGDGAIRFELATGDSTVYANPSNLPAFHVADITRVGQEIWFATSTGVARYDVRLDHWSSWQQKDGFRWRSAQSLVLSQGDLFAGTATGDVIAFDRASEGWLPAASWGDELHPPFNTIFTCTMDGPDLLVGTAGGGAARFSPSTGAWARIGGPAGEGEGPQDILIYDIEVTGSETWFANHKGIAVHDEATGTWSFHRTDPHNASSRRNNPVRDVDVAGDEAWAATVDHQVPERQRRSLPEGASSWVPGNLSRLDRATGEWTRWGPSDGLPSSNITAVEPDGTSVWVGTQDAGLVRFDPQEGVFETVIQDGAVSDLLLAHDRLWVATLEGNVFQITDQGSGIEKLPGSSGTPYLSLAASSDRLWIGTAGDGLRAYDPATGDLQVYRASPEGHLWTRCLVPLADLVVAGTQWGIERFDVEAETWLPQGRDFAGMGQKEASIVLDAPEPGSQVPAGELVVAGGTVEGLTEGSVQIRVGSGPWRSATGLERWNGSGAVPATTGEVELVARVLVDGATVGQAATTVNVVKPTGSRSDGTGTDEPGVTDPGPVRAHHDPVLSVLQGERTTFVLTLASRSLNATPELVYDPLGEPGPQIHEMDQATDRRWVVGLGPFETVGRGAYRFQLQGTPGTTILPDPSEGFGASYPLTVRANPGEPSLFVVPFDTEVALGPGQAHELRFSVQNTGSRGTDVLVELSGAGATWLDDPPRAFHLDATSSRVVSLNVTIPPHVAPGSYTLEVAVRSAQASTESNTASTTLTIHSVDGPLTEKRDGREAIPSPGIWWVTLGISAAVILRRDARGNRQLRPGVTCIPFTRKR